MPCLALGGRPALEAVYSVSATPGGRRPLCKLSLQGSKQGCVSSGADGAVGRRCTARDDTRYSTKKVQRGVARSATAPSSRLHQSPSVDIQSPSVSNRVFDVRFYPLWRPTDLTSKAIGRWAFWAGATGDTRPGCGARPFLPLLAQGRGAHSLSDWSSRCATRRR